VNATVLTLGLYRGSGGPNKSIKAFAEALHAKVISWVDPDQYASEPLIWDASTIVRGVRFPVLQQLLIPRHRDLAAAERIVAESDVVSCHSFWRWHIPWLHRVAKRHRVPYWFVPHGILDPYAFKSDKLFKKAFLEGCARGFLEDAAAVVCSASREYEKLRDVVPNVPPAIIHWPLSDADFREPSPTARQRCRQDLGISEDAFCLLYFGRLDPMKRPLETIDAAAEGGGATTHLIIIGNDCGVTRSQCEQRAFDRGMAGRVHVVGPRYGHERTPFFDACDAYISLSQRENFNFTAMECLASGIPVMLSSGNDIAGDIADVGCGWMMTAADDPAGMVEAVRGTSKESLRAMGVAGREWALRHLRTSHFQHQLTALAWQCGSRSG